MSWRNLIGYWSILGLATKSSRWEQSMNQNLLLMTKASAESAAAASSGAENEELAVENSEKATADQAEGAALQEEAVALFEKSEADFALVAAEETELDELEAEIVLEEEEGAAHAAAVAADEFIFESETAQGTADAAEAFELEAEARGEEVGITVCEFIPLLDVVCDIVGGVSAVGLEISAAGEAAKASAELAAAGAAKADEDREIAIESEIQAKVAVDGLVAIGLRDQEAELEAQAEAEQLEGEEKQAASELLYEQAEVEEQAAVELEALAAEQEESAAEQATEAISYVVKSCWDAIMAGVAGAFALLFFTFRLTISHFVPAAMKLRTFRVADSGVENTSSFGMLRHVSYFLQHCLIFVFIAGFFSNILPGLERNSLKARGGIVVLFGASCSLVHTFCLHVIPELCLREYRLHRFVIRAISRFLAFFLLFILEALILWVCFGQALLQGRIIDLFGAMEFRALCIVLVTCHVVFVGLQITTGSDDVFTCYRPKTVEDANPLGSHNNSLDEVPPCETDSLLPTKAVQSEHSCRQLNESNSPVPLIALVKGDFGVLQLPFEVLVLSCMIALMSHCIPSVIRLWPASKELLIAARPDWLVPMLCIATFSLLSVLVYSAMRKGNSGEVKPCQSGP